MDIFEILRTSFRLIVAFLTPDILIYIGLAALGLMILWSILLLVTSFESKFARRCNNIIKFIKNQTINADNYSQFTALWLSFPTTMRRAWKRYETKRVGIPSDYINQSECLDGVLEGGFNKQSRSLMKSTINTVTIILAIFSVAIIGTTQTGLDVVLTTKIVAEALLIPLIFLFLFKANYYIYMAVRHHHYKVVVDTFHDFVDTLDENIDITSIFFGGEQSISLISNIFENATVQNLREKRYSDLKNNKNRNEKMFASGEIKVSKGLNPPVSDIVSNRTDDQSNRQKNVISDKAVDILIELNSSPTTASVKKKGKYDIENEEDFVSVMEKVEKLLSEAKKERDAKKRKSINNQINKYIASMTAYKNKVKKSKK